MYFSRLKIGPAQDFRALGRSEYDIHQALWNLFADHPERNRDFLYRKDISEPEPLFYTVSARPPDDHSGRWSVETKQYHPDLRYGDILEFSLRVNPVRTIKDEAGRRKRVDVVMDEKYRARSESRKDEIPSQTELMRSGGLKWLESRASKLGFEFDPERLLVDGYCIHTFFKNAKLNRKKNRIRFASLDFEGVCTVTDPEAMLRALFQGVGSAKAFGCGLMLVRRCICCPD